MGISSLYKKKKKCVEQSVTVLAQFVIFTVFPGNDAKIWPRPKTSSLIPPGAKQIVNLYFPINQ